MDLGTETPGIREESALDALFEPRPGCQAPSRRYARDGPTLRARSTTQHQSRSESPVEMHRDDPQQTVDELRQLNEQLERRTRRLTVLCEIGHTLAATLHLHEIYRVLFREIAAGLLGAPHLSVALFDQETETIRCGFVVVDGEEMDPSQFPSIPLGDGPVSDAVRSRQPRVVDLRDALPHPQVRGRAVPGGPDKMPRSALYVPMIGGDRVVGVMHVQHYERNAFRYTDLQLLSALASQAAVALINAQLYAQEQKRADVSSQALEQQRERERFQNEFLQNISHELRTPLAIIYGYVNLLDSGELGELPPEHKGPMNIITRRVQLLRKMVEDIATIWGAETQEVAPEPVDLSNLVRTQLEDFQISAQQAGLTLAVDITADLPPVSGHVSRLRRVLDNLVGNALKFTPSGGTITLRLGQQGAEVVLAVADTGVGIPGDQLERIFERFYRVNGGAPQRYKGSGLGLALVKEIVEAHGGEITVHSKVGEGSTFQVRLPGAMPTPVL